MPVNQSIKRASITAYEILNNSGVNIIEFNKDKNLSPIVSTEYYDLAGHRISSNGIASGIYLKVNHHADGTITSEKRIR